MVRQERSRRFSSERVHSLLTVPSAGNAHARQAAGTLTLLTLRTANTNRRTALDIAYSPFPAFQDDIELLSYFAYLHSNILQQAESSGPIHGSSQYLKP